MRTSPPLPATGAARPRQPGAYDLFVFDLDGTLVDSLEDLSAAVNHVLRGRGLPALPSECIREAVGNGAPELVRRCMEARGAAREGALEEFLRYYEAHCVEHTRLYDGIPETLNLLGRRAVLALLTNKPETPSRRILDQLGVLSCFGYVVGGDTLETRKPDPLGLQTIMKAASVPPARTVMVGDSLVDMETARRAGVAACRAGWGMKSMEIPDADLTALHPSELLGLAPQAGG